MVGDFYSSTPLIESESPLLALILVASIATKIMTFFLPHKYHQLKDQSIDLKTSLKSKKIRQAKARSLKDRAKNDGIGFKVFSNADRFSRILSTPTTL